MKNLNKWVLSLAVVFALFACNTSTQNKKAEKEVHEKSGEKKHVHWVHASGAEGPENWKNLCEDFLPCGGSAQSPINIITDEVTKVDSLLPLTVNYGTTDVDIINNGHTVQFNVNGNNTLTIKDKEYQLLQFHYHALSEHTVNGEHYPLEVHFVHKHSDTDLLVMGILFKEGEPNPLFAKYLANFPKGKGDFTAPEQIELMEVIPGDLSYYHYNGSLTTPPCSEIVTWYMLQTPLEASKEQIEEFSAILNSNYRPTLPLNERKVVAYSAK